MEGKLTCVPRDEVLRYLGGEGRDPSPELTGDVDRCTGLLLRTAKPRVVWRRLSLGEDGEPVGTDFRFDSRDVRALLSGCEAVILFAATLGAEAEALIRRTQVTCMADAVILDACGSAAIENVCDNLCADLAEQEAPLVLTPRFSPGYGDLSLAKQAGFFRLLDITRRIGATLSPGGLMLPQKSVTALMGVSSVPLSGEGGGCGVCRLRETCSYRKDGKTCEKL